MRVLRVAPAAGAFALRSSRGGAKPGARLYIMDCGHNAATDQSRWSPGVNVGKPIELSDNCYLIKHSSDLLLWDTGYPDSVAEKPLTIPIRTATRATTLAAPPFQVCVSPSYIRSA